MHARFLVLLPIFAAMTSCADKVAEPQAPLCASAALAIHTDFAGADADGCTFSSERALELVFEAEDAGVSGSFSWFAFRVSVTSASDVEMTLRFPNSYARFWPKLSVDGEHWQRAAESDVTLLDEGKTLRLRLRVDTDGLWVSAQELLTAAWYEDWLAELGAHEELTLQDIGRSVEQRPIQLVATADKPEAVLLLGRQHPTEVPGAIAMREFVNVVLGDSELARRFRQRFAIFIVPLVNPDGVQNGNSRHNAGGVDLNRDWGPFTQAETQSIAAWLQTLEQREVQLRLMLDFHATRESPTILFYTQTDQDRTDPPLFASRWLGAVRSTIGDYPFVHEPRDVIDQANTKNYFFRRYGIPAMTYEIGDEIDRVDLLEHTPAFAVAMMQEMLRE